MYYMCILVCVTYIVILKMLKTPLAYCWVSELMTDNFRIDCIPFTITDGSPYIVNTDFHPSLIN